MDNQGEIDVLGIPPDLLNALLDNPYESLILVDAQGIVKYMSSSNKGVYSVTPDEAIGKHIREVSPQTRMDRVLRTQKAEIGRRMVLDEKPRIISRIPLLKDGKLVGAAGKLMFMHPGKLKELHERIHRLEQRIDYYKSELNRFHETRYSFENIMGTSEPILKVKRLARRAAQTDSPVIITGESGTGKELFAHAIHRLSDRRNRNFIKVNCAALPGELFESELFGYEPGAFTGASKSGKPGKFELAHRGTILLDEIGDMPASMQMKLLRVLQEKEVERLGGGRPRNVDFRLICATNKNLKSLVESGDFRHDLYYRINVMMLDLPPLRDCKSDIFPIFKHFVRVLTKGKKTPEVLAGVKESLENYSWPGNMRELRNSAERALIVCDQKDIKRGDIPEIGEGPSIDANNRTGKQTLKYLMEETERRAVQEALAETSSRAEAARRLNIHRTGLYQKMKKYGLG